VFLRMVLSRGDRRDNRVMAEAAHLSPVAS
jgi:hypothetical protein